MPGFSFQYFCYFVANLTWGLSWVVFGLFFYLCCQKWGCGAGCTALFRMTAVSGRVGEDWSQDRSQHCCLWPLPPAVSVRPVPTGCSVCTGWASDAAEMLGQNHREMWWKPSTSACAVWRAGHADRGMAHVKVVLVGFLTDVFSPYSGVFLPSGSCESWSYSPGQ